MKNNIGPLRRIPLFTIQGYMTHYVYSLFSMHGYIIYLCVYMSFVQSLVCYVFFNVHDTWYKFKTWTINIIMFIVMMVNSMCKWMIIMLKIAMSILLMSFFVFGALLAKCLGMTQLLRKLPWTDNLSATFLIFLVLCTTCSLNSYYDHELFSIKILI